MKTRVQFIATAQLSPTQRAQLQALYEGRCHRHSTPFSTYLLQHTHFSLYQQNRRLTGFTGLHISPPCPGQDRLIVHYGQTVLPPEEAPAELLPRTGLQVLRFCWPWVLRYEAWACFDALRYKPFLLAQRRPISNYPTCHGPLPPTAQRLSEQVGPVNYGDSFCPLTGKVRPQANTSLSSSITKQLDQALFAKSITPVGEGRIMLCFVKIDHHTVADLLWAAGKEYLVPFGAWSGSANRQLFEFSK